MVTLHSIHTKKNCLGMMGISFSILDDPHSECEDEGRGGEDEKTRSNAFKSIKSTMSTLKSTHEALVVSNNGN